MVTGTAWRENILVEYDEVLDKLVDKILVLNLVTEIWNGYQSRAKADGKIVRVHHILVADWNKNGPTFAPNKPTLHIEYNLSLRLPVFGKMVKKCKQVSHYNEDWSWPSFHEVANFHHELVLGFQF